MNEKEAGWTVVGIFGFLFILYLLFAGLGGGESSEAVYPNTNEEDYREEQYYQQIVR